MYDIQTREGKILKSLIALKFVQGWPKSLFIFKLAKFKFVEIFCNVILPVTQITDLKSLSALVACQNKEVKMSRTTQGSIWIDPKVICTFEHQNIRRFLRKLH